MKKIQMIGTVFGRLEVISQASHSKGRIRYACKCECGNTIETLGTLLRSGKTRSCGCLHSEGNAATHRMSSSREYKIWFDMKRRCGDAKNKNFADYGGRGITVCERWKSFEEFYADMGACPAYHTLERVNNAGPYEPSNCKWISRRDQARNRRSNRLITYQGETHCVATWAETFSIPRDVLKRRLQLGWEIERAFTQEVRK